MTAALLAIGALGTLGGAAGLVAAFRLGQVEDGPGERRVFRASVAGLAVGSLAFLAAMVTAG